MFNGHDYVAVLHFFFFQMSDSNTSVDFLHSLICSIYPLPVYSHLESSFQLVDYGICRDIRCK